MGFGGLCVIFVIFVNFVCFNGSVVAFCVLYGFAVGFVIFFTALVLCSCGLYDLFLWCVCFPGCFVWWIVVWGLFGPIYDVCIICGLDFGLFGWPSLAVCVPLI